MLAIQNQIPILSKLLSTVVQQQQQHVQSHQQDAAAPAGVPTAPARTRKTSSNQDLGGQLIIADAEVGGTSAGGVAKREAAAMAEEAEGRSCVIS